MRFKEFLKKLRAKYPFRKMALFMDNLAVHKTKAVAKVMEQLLIKPLFNVPYCPDYNPIETVFSQVKRDFKKQKLNSIQNKLNRSQEEMIKATFGKVKKE